MYEIVWLTEERTHGYLINLGAYFSLIRYTKKGIDYEVFVDNNDFEYIDGENSDKD